MSPTTPQPPYEGHKMSPRWREVPFERLPVGLQRQISRREAESGSE